MRLAGLYCEQVSDPASCINTHSLTEDIGVSDRCPGSCFIVTCFLIPFFIMLFLFTQLHLIIFPPIPFLAIMKRVACDLKREAFDTRV